MTRIVLSLVIAVTLALTACDAYVALAAQWRYLGFEQLTGDATTADGFTRATINAGNGHTQADVASCSVSSGDVRYRVDGTAATSTVGNTAVEGTSIPLQGNDVLNNFSVIGTSGAFTLDCTLGGF